MKTPILAFAMMLALAVSGAKAEEKPDEIRIGITAFLTGPASVFGEPAKAAAEMMIEEINEEGGIGGVPVSATFVDEGAVAKPCSPSTAAWSKTPMWMPCLPRSHLATAQRSARLPRI